MIVTIVRWVVTALVVAGTIAWTLSEFHLGLAGALVGLLVELTAAQAGLALGAVLFGLRITHVIIGLGALTFLLAMNRRGRFTRAYHTPVELVGLYWHFVDIVWIVIFTLVYLIPS